jgi:pyruvate dehydrogenase E1 component alpha subunit
MPRTTIDLPYAVEYLSVLDADGNLDTALEPPLDDALLLKLYRTMLLARRFDERMLALQRQGRIGTFGPIKGQEAAQLGTICALRETDWMVPAFREGAAMLWRGTPLESLLLFWAGREEGLAGATERTLSIAVPVATQLPHAVGIAWAARYKKDPAVVMTYFGDGATSEGEFHEAMNFAGVMQLPVVFVCQNNQWAISTPRAKQTRAKTLAQKALAYGFPGIQVDGNDVLAVYAAAREAVDRARTGGGPTMIECVTYRLAMHTTADDPTRYRDEREVKEWERREPLLRFTKYLEGKGLLDKQRQEAMDEEVRNEIKAAVERFEAMPPPDPLEMFDYVYAQRPPELEAQRKELEAALAATDDEKPAAEPADKTHQWPN